jgi:hypothetical protein
LATSAHGLWLLIPVLGSATGFPLGWFIGRYAKRPTKVCVVLLSAIASVVVAALLGVVVWAATASGQGSGAGLVLVLGQVTVVAFLAAILWMIFAFGLTIGGWAGSRFRVTGREPAA